jgi:hypothetical protein
MSDPDRDRIVVEETPPRVERETTVISTGDGGGGGGAIVAILVVLVLAVLAFLYFGGYLGGTADKVDLNVNVGAPKVETPDIDINLPPPSTEPSEPANKTGN